MTLHELRQQFSHLSQTSFVLRGDTIGIVVDNAVARAEILVRGAHLLTYVPHGQKPVIWNSDASTYNENVTLHSGIPIIAPWFGDPTRNNTAVRKSITTYGMQQSHGFVRDVLWDTENIEEVSDVLTRITMTYEYHVVSDTIWKRPFRMVLIFTIGESLDIEMCIHNTGDTAFTYTGALHSYFALSDVENVTVPSFDGVSYMDTLDAWREKIWKGVLFIDRERDYIFLHSPQKQRIIDCNWQREVVLTTRGSASTVVWNPWIEKAKNLSGFLPGDYRNMICIETGQLHTDARTVVAGQKASFGVTIALQKID